MINLQNIAIYRVIKGSLLSIDMKISRDNDLSSLKIAIYRVIKGSLLSIDIKISRDNDSSSEDSNKPGDNRLLIFSIDIMISRDNFCPVDSNIIIIVTIGYLLYR